MAMSSWMLRSMPRSGRTRYGVGKREKEEDLFSIFSKQEPPDGFKGVLSKLCEELLEEKVLLNYLNTFVKLMRHYADRFDTIGFSRHDLLACLRLALVHESTMIRSAGLRCIRHTIVSEHDVILANQLLIPFLISRSLDVVLTNKVERSEAIKLMRKMLIFSPARFDAGLTRSLVSYANEITEGKDRLRRVCLATLCEIGVLNPNQFIQSCGVAALTRNLIECPQTPKIAESMCGVLLLLLDRPHTRAKAGVDLHALAAPLCDFHYKHGWKDKTRRDERELRLNCSRVALLSILRSWPGILHFCSPSDQQGFKAIVDILYLNQLEVRKAILDLLYELLGLPQLEWTDELSVALSAVDPCEPQASWRLKEDFIVAEGRAVLPNFIRTTPCVTDIHLALLLQCFLENGLLGALTEVITTSDTFISVRATVLLGEILRLVQLLLPPGCCNLSPSLPSLVEYATKSEPQAMAAITALQQLHKLMKKRPASYSLHLDYVIRNNYSRRAQEKQERFRRHRSLKSRISQVKSALKDGDDILKETGVLSSNDAFSWNWSLIKMVLQGEHTKKVDVSDSSHRTFIKRLLDFFMPSQNKYSHMDLGTSPASTLDFTTSGIELLNYLLEIKDPEYQSMLLDLFKDILNNIKEIQTSRNVHDCLFSPQHMINTQCQSYFLFIGQFARTEAGMWMLKSIEMFARLKELVTTTNHDCYVKLIISSLDYVTSGPCRDILEAVLVCKVESSRLYATQFMLVLLRAGCPNFAAWAVKLLVRQLQDKSKTVFTSAIAVLQEACELPDCLEALVDINPDLSKYGERGVLLFVRLLSTDKGFKTVPREKTVEEIKRWDEDFGYRYVKMVEEGIADALTLHQRNDSGKYDRRTSGVRGPTRKDFFLPPHLYGQLNAHAEGFQLLISSGSIASIIERLKSGKCATDDEIMKLKSALWTAGHISTSHRGFNYLNSFSIVEIMIHLATQSPVYSIRATAFYALGLVATTSLGADELCLNDWLAVRHDRHDYWPIVQEELQDTLYLSQFTAAMAEESSFSENPFLGESEHDDDITSDSDDKIEFPSPPTVSPDIRKVKLWTLPATKNPQEYVHKRSLSESKTFDTSTTSNGYEDHYGPLNITRQRKSSMTESTTSGVSSCDSLQNRQGPGVYLQTLSPIPSSTSLSTLKLPPVATKRTSQRISCNSAGSDASSSSATGSSFNQQLSIQNMLGYQTIRIIRGKDSINFQRDERDDYLFRPPPQTCRKSTIDTLFWQEPAQSSFPTQKVELLTASSPVTKDQIYLGICLPRMLVTLFPDDQSDVTFSRPNHHLEEPALARLEEEPKEGKQVESWTHSQESCLYCSQFRLSPAVNDFNCDPAKLDVLKLVERLANPVFSRTFQNQLLRLKQKEPQAFKDICVYSEVCKMCSECSYTISTRRILHELFGDVVYDRLLEIPRKILTVTGKIPLRDPPRRSISDITSPTDFKTLDSLKLISVENKFPITRTRVNTE